MCLLSIFHRTLPGAPLLVAANREEFFDRPFLPPHIEGRGARFLAGVDIRAGGTWLGVNEHRVVAAVTNRAKTSPPERPRSRGLLCRDLLECATAQEAPSYRGANWPRACTRARISSWPIRARGLSLTRPKSRALSR